MGTAAVLGAQSQKVVATAKHYTQNNQEYQRTSVNEVVDERTHMEMYLPPFEAAIAAGGAAAVMCSYNKVTITGPHSDNVTNWACEHPAALEGYLRGKLGFEGWVMSDWGATHSTDASLRAGLAQDRAWCTTHAVHLPLGALLTCCTMCGTGLDIEMPGGQYFSDANLRSALARGVITPADVDDRRAPPADPHAPRPAARPAPIRSARAGAQGLSLIHI